MVCYTAILFPSCYQGTVGCTCDGSVVLCFWNVSPPSPLLPFLFLACNTCLEPSAHTLSDWVEIKERKRERERERKRFCTTSCRSFSYTTSSSLLIALLPTYLLFSVVVMRTADLSSATPTRLVSNPASVPDSDVVMLEICAVMAA